MRYYDQHLHTYFSPDSSETFKNYLKQSNRPVVTTEHLDFYSPLQKRDPVIPDYEGYTKKIDELNKEYDGRLLKGIEVGFTYPDRQRIRNFMKGKEFDIVLLSIHHNGRYGFMDLNHDTKDLTEHLDEYFNLMLQGVQHVPEANVLAHFDFGLRGYDDVAVEDLYPYEKVLTQIFKTMIKNNQALELNTRSMYRYNNVHLYDYVIDLYKSLGGEMFVVSSDAHVAEDYQLQFDEAFSLLEKHAIHQLVVFKEREPHFVELPASIKQT